MRSTRDDHDRVELGAWLGAATDPQRWHHEALCAQTDSEVFQPEKGESPRPPKVICARCPVTEDCLAHALVI